MAEKQKEEMEKGPVRWDDSNWELLEDVFDSTYEILQEVAKDKGTGIDSIYTDEVTGKGIWDDFDPELEEDDKEYFLVDTYDLVKICLIYETLAEECLDIVFGLLDEQDWKEGSKQEKETEEALDIVNWYLDVIQPKLKQALYNRLKKGKSALGKEAEMMCNGSAKVALIGIVRSMEAWYILEKYCTSVADDIFHIRVVLEQLEREIDRQFPDARTFLRPGFDI